MQPRTATPILICEDDENLRQLIRVVIGDGYPVVEAETGDEALALARELHPELVILDLMLPGMSGLDVLRELRAEHGENSMHVLVMSAWPHAGDAAREAGADSFLPKPFEPDHLVEIVSEVLGGPAS